MESSSEGRRLREQENANPSSVRLRAAGLRSGQRAIDVGCGSGAVMPAMLELVGPTGSVTGVDASPDRVAEAKRLVPSAELAVAALPRTGLPSDSFDFSWSQFVFEYLREPEVALRELIRITRPGGTVAVADIDGVGLSFWPRPKVVEDGLPLLISALESTGFDFFVGRKLFTWFKRAGLIDLNVHLSALHVSPGADARLHADYVQRFDVLAPLATKTFGSEQRYREFAQAYLALLNDEEALKYTVVLTVSGRRPA